MRVPRLLGRRTRLLKQLIRLWPTRTLTIPGAPPPARTARAVTKPRIINNGPKPLPEKPRTESPNDSTSFGDSPFVPYLVLSDPGSLSFRRKKSNRLAFHC